jgi:uncharacterized flavoprotein (TIGR03862 family)
LLFTAEINSTNPSAIIWNAKMTKKKIAIIGSGPAALMLAAQLDNEQFDIRLFEQNKTAGRKFLVAGDGGLNLSHSESIEVLITRYHAQPSDFLIAALNSFTNLDLVNFFKELAIPTFIGTSGRVFPETSIKPITVLNALLKKVVANGTTIFYEHQWIGWNESNNLLFKTPSDTIVIESDITVFALGGGSWSVTGSDGNWLSIFKNKGIEVLPFQTSNCNLTVSWPTDFIAEQEGAVLKNIALSCESLHRKGELVITKSGIEGGAVYWLSTTVRAQLKKDGIAKISIDLKPIYTFEELSHKLNSPARRQSVTSHLATRLNLSDKAIALLKQYCTKEEFNNMETLAFKIKNLQLTIIGTAVLDESISTVGGIALKALDANFQLVKMPHHYAIGEMLDWDAPTGGYLLQASFSMGNYVAKQLNKMVAVS